MIPIAAAASGVRDMIEDGAGFIVDRPGPGAFAEAMAKVARMSTTERAAMSRAAHAKAASGFAVDAVAGQLLALFGAAVPAGAP